MSAIVEDTFSTTIPVQTRRLIQNHKTSAKWLQILLDITLVIGLLFVHTYLKTGNVDPSYRTVAVVTALLMLVLYNWYGMYSRMMGLLDQTWVLLKAWATLLVILVALGFVTKTSHEYSREVFLSWSVSAFLGQVLAFFLVRALQQKSRTDTMPTLMIGAQELGRHLADHINRNNWIPDVIVGVVDDDAEHRQRWDLQQVPVLGDLDAIPDLIAKHKIRRVYISLPMSDAHLIKPIYLDLVEFNVDIIWAPDIFGVNLLNHSIKEIAGVPLISLSETPLIGSAAFTKNVMDKTLVALGLVALSPFLLLTALIIKLTSPGPVFFRQKRHGWDGQILNIYKFRSMYVHVESDDQVTQACKHDSRVTPFGQFMRRTSIDELPQLLNVLEGSMSLVGPRPHAMVHNEFYNGKIRAYMSRHRIKPGLTGLAQVNGHRGETETLEKMQDRVQYDLSYINNWSVWLDIKIIIKTVFVLLGKNAY